MFVKIKLIASVLLCALVLSLSACAIRLDDPVDISSEDEARNMGFAACEYDGEIVAGEYEYLEVEIKLDYEHEVTWSSSDTQIAVVDSRGRVDGIKPGNVVITAHAKSASIDYEIEVTKAAKTALTYSNAIITNEEYVEEIKASGEDKNLYGIIVNEYNCCVTVFALDPDSDKYNKPVRSMVCSVGESGKTPNITENITDKADWVYLSDGNYYRYATYIGEELMFQSSPYSDEKASALIADEFNKIGTPATVKNIRLSVADAKWIYDNCAEGTVVQVVNDEDVSRRSPLGVPEPIRLTENSKSLKWDPTDSDKENPYTKLKPQVIGAEDTVIGIGTGFDLYGGVTAVDTCGNDISGNIKADGDFNRNREGRYIVSYYVTDVMGRTTRLDRQITVVEDVEEYTATSAATE